MWSADGTISMLWTGCETQNEALSKFEPCKTHWTDFKVQNQDETKPRLEDNLANLAMIIALLHRYKLINSS